MPWGRISRYVGNALLLCLLVGLLIVWTVNCWQRPRLVVEPLPADIMLQGEEK